MKKLIVMAMLLAISGNAHALRPASKASTTAGETAILISTSSSNAGSRLDFISVSNSNANPCRIDVWDSTTASKTYKFSIEVPAKKTKTFKLGIRFSFNCLVFCESANMTITAGYESGTYGHYGYGVQSNNTQETMYNSPCDVIGILVANTNADTGRCVDIYDSGTLIARAYAGAYDTEYTNLDYLHCASKIQLTPEVTGLGVMVIRRAE
jgi:hypothetical protein